MAGGDSEQYLRRPDHPDTELARSDQILLPRYPHRRADPVDGGASRSPSILLQSGASAGSSGSTSLATPAKSFFPCRRCPRLPASKWSSFNRRASHPAQAFKPWSVHFDRPSPDVASNVRFPRAHRANHTTTRRHRSRVQSEPVRRCPSSFPTVSPSDVIVSVLYRHFNDPPNLSPHVHHQTYADTRSQSQAPPPLPPRATAVLTPLPAPLYRRVGAAGHRDRRTPYGQLAVSCRRVAPPHSTLLRIAPPKYAVRTATVLLGTTPRHVTTPKREERPWALPRACRMWPSTPRWCFSAPGREGWPTIRSYRVNMCAGRG